MFCLYLYLGKKTWKWILIKFLEFSLNMALIWESSFESPSGILFDATLSGWTLSRVMQMRQLNQVPIQEKSRWTFGFH